MLKRTLYFGSPCHLSLRLRQLICSPKSEAPETSVPIEDIGFLILDHPLISYSLNVVQELINNNVALVFCNASHMPHAMALPFTAHHTQCEITAAQLRAPLPLKKRLWKQTVQAKITNQARLLDKLHSTGKPLHILSRRVRSGDASNLEAYASRLYWNELFKPHSFVRDRDGAYPNNLLNYGYAILRAAVARALVGSGLLTIAGIHHHNRYNAYCLADDIMEPYRPFVDELVCEYVTSHAAEHELNKDAKAALLRVLAADVAFPAMQRPLMLALSQTTASLARCFCGAARSIEYPQLIT